MSELRPDNLASAGLKLVDLTEGGLEDVSAGVGGLSCVRPDMDWLESEFSGWELRWLPSLACEAFIFLTFIGTPSPVLVNVRADLSISP